MYSKAVKEQIGLECDLRLVDLAEALQVPVPARLHRAKDDCDLLEGMATRLFQRATGSSGSIAEVCAPAVW